MLTLSGKSYSTESDPKSNQIQKNLEEKSTKVEEIRGDLLSTYALSVTEDTKSFPDVDFSITKKNRVGCAIEVAKLADQNGGLFNPKNSHFISFGRYQKSYGHYITGKGFVAFARFEDKRSSKVIANFKLEGVTYYLARSYTNFAVATSYEDLKDSGFIKERSSFIDSNIKLIKSSNNKISSTKDYLKSLDGFIKNNVQNISKGLKLFRSAMAQKAVSKFDSMGLKQLNGVLRCELIYANSKDKVVHNSIREALSELKNHIFIPEKKKD